MQVIADERKISETVWHNLTFILNVLGEPSIHFTPSFQKLFLREMLVFSHKLDFAQNETALLAVTMQEHARAFAVTI